MERKILFSEHFRKKMFTMALVTGLFITFSMPITFFALTMSEEKRQAFTHSSQIAEEVLEAVKEEPELWQYNVQKFLTSFNDFYNDHTGFTIGSSELSNIKIYDNNRQLIFEKEIGKSFALDITGKTDLLFNNSNFGYIVVKESTSHVLMVSLILLALFGLLGFSLGWSLYRFPAGIVIDAENRIAEVFEKLKFLSYHDLLTDLPNRAGFNECMEQLLEQAGHSKRKLAVMFLDMDRFKMINDTAGHDIGDLALRKIAERLKLCVRKDDVIARLGGDEFAILLPDIEEIREVSRVAQRIVNACSEPLVLEGYEFYISVSIGVSIYPLDGKNGEELLQKADKAMYRAKESGLNKFQFSTMAFDS